MSTTNKDAGRFWEAPHATVNLLIILNIVIFGLCALASHSYAISNEILLGNGGMYRPALERHEYWRLFAYGFLHVNVLHLATNMICLALWGSNLERRVGSFYFIIIYVSALMCGALISHAVHKGNYVSVGASGAISGVLGALLCLWILAKTDLSASFFVINIGVNVALTYSSPEIDWGAHLGGFVAGFVMCAILDLIEKALPFFLRCKFPEFVKVNGLIALSLAAAIALKQGTFAFSFDEGGKQLWLDAAVFGLAFFALIKSIDLMLSVKKGLALIVVALALANASLWLSLSRFRFFEDFICLAQPSKAFLPPQFAGSKAYVCSNWELATNLVAALIFTMTLALYAKELFRGLKDVGFVGSSFVAERRRRYGL